MLLTVAGHMPGDFTVSAFVLPSEESRRIPARVMFRDVCFPVQIYFLTSSFSQYSGNFLKNHSQTE